MDPRGLSGEVAFDLRCEQNELVTQSIRLFVTPRTVPHQAPLSMEFSRQEYWSGLPSPPDPGITPGSPALQADALLSEPPGTRRK